MFNKLTIHAVNLVTTGGYFGALFGAYLSHTKRIDGSLWPYLIFAALFLAVFASIFNYWRLLKISEAAISSIGAAAQGYIELQGIATTQNGKPLKTPFQSISCVLYRASAYSDEVDERGERRSRLLEYLESKAIFQLSDGTGVCLVNPEGAEIMHLTQSTTHNNNHRYVEEYLPSNARLHVIGNLDTQNEYNTTKGVNSDVSKLLTELKANKTQLLNRYDQNRDDEIDMQEWEQVRADVLRQVESTHAMKAQEAGYMLSKPSNSKLFLISALSPQKMRALLTNWHRIHLFAAFLFGCMLLKYM